MTFVVDASVAVKWVLAEEGSRAAAALREDPELIAPSLIVAEIGNALWRAVRSGTLLRSEASESIEAALLPFELLVPLEELRVRALSLGFGLNHPIYDCFYLALAEREACPIVTADEKMIAAARKAKIKARRI
jgi:predicted nucleic acid-binding protein